VRARPDTPWYRFRRFVTRHKLQAAAVTVTLLAIIGGGATAVWQARAATQERDRAVALASRNGAVTDFMGMLINEVAESDEPITIAEMLARSEKLAVADTGSNAENRAAVLGMIAERYNTMGDLGKAAQLGESALALISNSGDSGLRAQLICQHALAISSQGRADVAVRDISRELDDPKLDPENAANCLLIRAFIAAKSGDAAGALRYATLGLDRYYQAPRKALVHEGVLLGAVATGHYLNGHTDQANRYFELALQKYTEAGRERSPDAHSLINNWALVSNGAGVPKRALELYDRALSVVAPLSPKGGVPANVISNRGRALESIGRYAKARDAYELALHLAEQQKRMDTRAYCLLGLASITEKSGDRALATRYLQQMIELMGSSTAAGHPIMMRRALVLGRLDLAAGRPKEALAQFELVLDRKREDWMALDAGLGKAAAQLLAGDAAAAQLEARAVLNLATSLQGSAQYSSYTGLSWLMLGRASQARGDTNEVHKAFESAVVHLSNTVDADHPDLLQARELLAASGLR
jgi:serine/threonine-protein kinase